MDGQWFCFDNALQMPCYTRESFICDEGRKPEMGFRGRGISVLTLTNEAFLLNWLVCYYIYYYYYYFYIYIYIFFSLTVTVLITL